MLETKCLSVSIGERRILHDVSLTIPDGEVHALFGPNGSGKTTLIRAVMGFPEIRVDGGAILFDGENVIRKSLDQRARMGMGISLQRPPTLRGVKLRQLVEFVGGGRVDGEGLARAYRLDAFLDRDVNAGFSGGEIKRAELLQLMAQDPRLLLLDEPESGVDLEAMQRVGEMVNRLLRRRDPCGGNGTNSSTSGLIITHTGGILDHVRLDLGHVLCDGRLTCSQKPHVILDTVRAKGYEACLVCDLGGAADGDRR